MKILFQFGQFSTPRTSTSNWTTLISKWIDNDEGYTKAPTQPTVIRTTSTTTWSPPTAWSTTTQTASPWTYTPLRPSTTVLTTRRPVTYTTKPNTVKPVPTKPGVQEVNCSSVASSSLPQDSTLILGVGLLLVLGVVSLIGIQFYTLYTKHSSKSESIQRNHPYRGPARRPSPEYQIAERVYPGLPSYEARVSEIRFSDINSSSSDFDLKGLPHGNEVPITKTKFKTYFALQKAKKSTISSSGLPRDFKSNKVSFKRSPERYRQDNRSNSDEN